MAQSNYKWYEDAPILRRFYAVLRETGMLEEIDEIDAYFQKPWKYNAYHEIWENNGAPQTSDDDGWEDFVDEITEDDDAESEDDEEPE